MLRIAIIDSGVHVAHPHIGGIIGGVGIDDDGRAHDDFVDRLGHGTAVTAAIYEKAAAAELFAIKVFDRQLRATGAALVAALREARAAGADIVNLSLGTTNREYAAALQEQVHLLADAGAVVVAAAPQAGQHWLPGALDAVVGVELDMSLARHECRAAIGPAGQVVIAASGYPRPIPGVPPERNLQGLSFAVANATGLVARAWPAWQEALLRPSSKSL